MDDSTIIIALLKFLVILEILMLEIYVCFSTRDWKYGAEQFVKLLPDKVIVHCKKREVSASLMYS